MPNSQNKTKQTQKLYCLTSCDTWTGHQQGWNCWITAQNKSQKTDSSNRPYKDPVISRRPYRVDPAPWFGVYAQVHDAGA